MKIIWSPLALERVSEIADYIAQDNASAAEKWLKSVFDRVLLLKHFPHSGRIVPEVNRPEIREVFVKKYRIIYRVDTKSLSILTVRHGLQLLPIDEVQQFE